MLFIPPEESIDFFSCMLSLYIPSINNAHTDKIACLSLACIIVPSGEIRPKTKTISPAVKSHPSSEKTPPSFDVPHPSKPDWNTDLQFLTPLNINRLEFANLQRKDSYLGPLIQYLQDPTSLSLFTNLAAKMKRWIISVAKRTKLIDGILYYSDEFMPDSLHLHIYVPSDTDL